MIIRNTRKRRLVVGVSLFFAACLAGVGYYFYAPRILSHCRSGIMPYDATCDREAIIKLFKENWYWLIPEESTFSVEDFLDRRLSAQESTGEREETIVVYRVDRKTIGMAAYYPESFCKGKLHFIVIDKRCRGRGYAEELMRYALESMKKGGMRWVDLITRVDNIPAQKLYAKFGFKEFWRDNRFVRFEKELV